MENKDYILEVLKQNVSAKRERVLWYQRIVNDIKAGAWYVVPHEYQSRYGQKKARATLASAIEEHKKALSALAEFENFSREERTMKTEKELAELIEKTVLHWDPYIGFDPGDTIADTARLLKTRAGCLEVIEQFCEMIMEA